MDELQVVVKQEPGVIKWNFEDLKTALTQELKQYESMVYTDDSIKVAKDDVAMLRKLRKSVEDKRKEIKNKCLEPYNTIETQAKELTGLIDKPITLIAKQVSEYEEQKKAAKKARIMQYMTDVFQNIPQDIQKKAQLTIYDTRWENATAKESEWKTAINKAAEEITSSLRIINGVDEDFREEALRVYRQSLCLQDAIVRVQDLQKQKEMILERERRREEEKRRLEAEATEKARQEAEAQKNAVQAVQETDLKNHAQETHNCEPASTQPAPPVARATENIDRQDFNRTVYFDHSASVVTIQLHGASESQVTKILDYIKFIGVKYEVTR